MRKWMQEKLPKIVGFGLNTIGMVAPAYAAKKALDIFCTPRGGSIKHYHKTFLDTIPQKKLDVDGLDIQTYFIDKKARKTVLLVHGWESNMARWKRLIKHLKDEDINIVGLDGPAHGASGSNRFNGILYAKMIDRVIDEYQPQVVIGHSIGAFSSAAFIHLHGPKSIKDFIILASPNSMTDLTQQYFDIIGLGKKVATRYHNSFTDWFPHPIPYYSTANFLENSNIKGMLIHDEDDIINPYFNATQIMEKWSHAQLITTQGLGHSLQSKSVFNSIQSYIRSI